MRRWLWMSALLIAAGGVFAASEEDAGRRQYNPDSGKFVVHEWGVIRISQRSDRALNPADIPEFVAREESAITVKCIDKPVLYFYSGKERALDVAVGIPSYAEILSWPPAKAGEYQERVAADKAVDGRGAADELKKISDALIDRAGPVAEAFWENVVVSMSQECSKARKVDTKHWWHASRQVQSNVIKCGGEEEKFLFYESPGLSFDCGLHITRLATGEAQLQTTGNAATLTPCLAVWVDGKNGRALFEESLDVAANTQDTHKPTLLNPKSVDSVALSSAEWKSATLARLQRELEKAGLYTDEAAEVAGIWNEEFFQQEGRRIVYFMPVEQVDEMLPLYFSETPDTVVRVMMVMIEY